MSQPQPAPHHIDPERLTREMNWNLLRTFVVLAESGSVTEAAEQLRLKQPTVSVALKKLEDQLGQRLIDRSPGHFALTEAGELLYREAVNINGSILRLATLMRTVAPEISGHVRIAVASHVLCPLLDSVIGDFHRVCHRGRETGQKRIADLHSYAMSSRRQRCKSGSTCSQEGIKHRVTVYRVHVDKPIRQLERICGTPASRGF